MSIASLIEDAQEPPAPRPHLLLHPNIPAPLHGTAPRAVLGSRWWRLEKAQALEQASGHCMACGVAVSLARLKRRLECHEVYRINYSAGRMTYLETVAICHCCHSYIHDGRLRSLLERRQITQQRFATIIQHGDRVLREAGLERKPPEARLPKEVAPWSKWRLVVNGEEYQGQFASETDWEKHHS